MDHADPPLAGSLEPLHDSLAGTDAGLGEKYTMNAHRTSTEMGWGRGTAPSPDPIPKTKRGHLHKSLDTPDRNEHNATFRFGPSPRNSACQCGPLTGSVRVVPENRECKGSRAVASLELLPLRSLP